MHSFLRQIWITLFLDSYRDGQAGVWSVDEPREEHRAGAGGEQVHVAVGVHLGAVRRGGGRSVGVQSRPPHRQDACRGHQERKPDQLIDDVQMMRSKRSRSRVHVLDPQNAPIWARVSIVRVNILYTIICKLHVVRCSSCAGRRWFQCRRIVALCYAWYVIFFPDQCARYAYAWYDRHKYTIHQMNLDKRSSEAMIAMNVNLRVMYWFICVCVICFFIFFVGKIITPSRLYVFYYSSWCA